MSSVHSVSHSRRIAEQPTIKKQQSVVSVSMTTIMWVRDGLVLKARHSPNPATRTSPFSHCTTAKPNWARMTVTLLSGFLQWWAEWSGSHRSSFSLLHLGVKGSLKYLSSDILLVNILMLQFLTENYESTVEYYNSNISDFVNFFILFHINSYYCY